MCSHCDGHPEQEKFVREFNERREAEKQAAPSEPPAFPSPLLAKHKLDVSWEDL